MWGKEILENANAVVVYFAILLVLVFLVVYHLSKTQRKEHAQGVYLGTGTTDSTVPFTSGATMRVLGQEFSGTDQGTYGIVHNAELKELVGNKALGLSKERLVNERGMPDFWEISSELGAYRDEQAAAFRKDMAAEAAAPKTERLGNLSPAQDIVLSEQEKLLYSVPATAYGMM